MKKLLLLPILFFISAISAQNDSILSPKLINQINEFVKSKKDYYNSPSIAVAITDENKTVYLKHFGNAKKGDKYLIGSNTKSFTALLTLLLQEKGMLDINDPVNKYLKWFTYKNKNVSDRITLKDLLKHTSGLNTEMGRTFLENDESFDYTTYYSEKFKELNIVDSPNQRFKYSNANYRLLGLIIEKITGKSYEDCLKTYVTKPMLLNNTDAIVNPELIDSYQYFLYSPSLKFDGEFHRQEIPSGLISSTAEDMSSYLRNLMNSYNNNPNTVVDTKITKQLFNSPNKKFSSYVLGWNVFNDVFYHSGTNKSFESSMYILPSIQKAVVVLINSNQAPDNEIVDGISSILLNQKLYNISFFPYYRALPYVVFALLALFVILFIKWIKLGFPIRVSKKIISNTFLILGLILSAAILIVIPVSNGVSLKTAILFDPASGYSIISIVMLLMSILILLYFNKNQKNSTK